MSSLGPTELVIVIGIVLMFAAWVYLFLVGGNALIVILLALLALFLPVIGPIVIFLFYRPRDSEKRD